MDNWVIAGLIGAVIFMCLRILEQLPKSRQAENFRFELPDEWVAVEIDNVMESDFKIAFIDGWDAGRGFSIYGKVLHRDETVIDGLHLPERIGIMVGPMTDWFKESRIGGVRIYESGGCEVFMGLPTDLAQALLNELRRDSMQIVRLGIKKVRGKDGRESFGLFSFELSKPF